MAGDIRPGFQEKKIAWMPGESGKSGKVLKKSWGNPRLHHRHLEESYGEREKAEKVADLLFITVNYGRETKGDDRAKTVGKKRGVPCEKG